jgi:hypothetical protein
VANINKIHGKQNGDYKEYVAGCWMLGAR